jgi:hypothetical protein
MIPDGDVIKKEVYDLTGLGFSLPTDSNVKESEESKKVGEEIVSTLGCARQMLYGSKSVGYKIAEKKGYQFIPNANIFMTGGYKVWYGDIETNKKSLKVLQKVAKKFNTCLYILRESLGRFLSQPPTDEYLEERCTVKVSSLDTATKNE